MVWPKNAVPASGRVLPVMTSIIVVLPAPLGPITQRSSPASIDERKIVQRLEAVEADRDAVEVEDDAVREMSSSLRVPRGRAVAARRRLRGACRIALRRWLMSGSLRLV